MKINVKVALLTGAAQGIGRCIALRLAKDSADIAIIDINTDKMADVSNRAEVYSAVEHAETTLGGLDIRVDNAGIAQVDAIADVTPEDVELILKINIQGVLWGIQVADAKFKSLGHKGKIINASSIAGHDGFEVLGVYSATKFAARADTGRSQGICQ